MSDAPQPPVDEPTADPPGDGSPPQGAPVLAPSWKRGCGLTIMIIGIIMTAFSGICTAGMTIGDMTSGGGGGGDLNLTGVQFVVGGPFILIGALLWWGGWALSKAKPSGGSRQAGPAGGPPPAPPAT